MERNPRTGCLQARSMPLRIAGCAGHARIHICRHSRGLRHAGSRPGAREPSSVATHRPVSRRLDASRRNALICPILRLRTP
eukprot:8005817-Pyramimonas_sp.AAC.1